MNAYDFDKTIYDGDSSLDFYFYCLRRRSAIIRYLPRQAGGILLYLLGLRDGARMKSAAFSFLAGLEDPEGMAEAFWADRVGRIMPWYDGRKRPDDIIASASPEFLLRPTGRVSGANCKGEEKRRRFLELFPDGRPGEFYSDSMSDAPMAELASKAYLVRKGWIMPWPRGMGKEKRA